MVRNGEVIASRCDYILGDDRRLFQAVGIREPRGYDSDHKAVIGILSSATRREHHNYLKGRKAFPLKFSRRAMSIKDRAFNTITQRASQPTASAMGPRRASWISDETWRLVDERASKRRLGTTDDDNLDHLNWAIRRSLRKDRKKRMELTGVNIENHLKEDDVKGAWGILKQWYGQRSGRPPKPSRMDFRLLEQEYGDLYRSHPSPGIPIQPNLPQPFNIPDGIPDDDEIAASVGHLKNGKASGPSGLNAERIKQWSDNKEGQEWKDFLSLVRECFATGEVPTAMAFSTLVLIPKTDGSLRGIGLLEVAWKVVSCIIQRRLQNNIEFHDSLHGFRPNRGTGTATLQLKLIMENNLHQGSTLHHVFLDLKKAYDTLDRQRTLLILA
jgi:Reverse transcriptase (RNA-dependent DNA polymerase)